MKDTDVDPLRSQPRYKELALISVTQRSEDDISGRFTHSVSCLNIKIYRSVPLLSISSIFAGLLRKDLMMRLNMLWILLAMGLTVSLYGQDRGGRPGGPPAKKIQGKIVDDQSGQGLEFATVSIFRKKDDSVAGGGLTEADGSFSLEARGGMLYAVIDFLGYESLTIDPLPLEKGVPVAKLGEIKLSPASINLDNVEITAERSETTFSLDKKVFTVGKDLANRGGSAEDILDNVPSVTVDIEGVVSLRGSEGVQILIDGKPSGLVGNGNSGLKNIPSNLISKVEVITNPSARYEAEGTAGIINIVLKKDQGHGFNGSIDVLGGVPAEAGITANLNYRKGPLNWFVNGGYNYRTGPGGGYSLQDRILQQNGEPLRQLTFLDRQINREGYNASFRFGADYFLSEKEQITAAFIYSYSDRDSNSDLLYEDYSDELEPLGLAPLWEDDSTEDFLDPDEVLAQLPVATNFLSSIRTDNEREFGGNQEYSLNYRKEFSSREHQLNITAQHRTKDETEDNVFREVITDNLTEEDNTLDQVALNEETESNWTLQADYVNPISKDHKWETGVRGTFRDITTDFIVQEKINDTEFQVIPGFQNIFNYDENILAGYFIYGNKKNNLSYQLGLRGEYSDINTLLTSPEGRSENPRNFFSLFPSGHLSYHVSETDAIQLSYSRRVRRPRFWTLNPFYTYQDRRNFFSGNPNLNPQFTDSYELSSIKNWEGLTLAAALYLRKTSQPTQRILSIDNSDFTTLRIPINIGVRDDYGLDLSLTYSQLSWLRITASADLYQSIQTLDREEAIDQVFEFYRDVRSYTSDRSTFDNDFNFNVNEVSNFTWNGRITARISAFDSDLQLRLNHRGSRETTQGFARAITSMDIGWSRDFLPSKNLTLTLSVRDVFNSRARADLVFLDEFFQQGQFQWRARSTRLTASYRINQKKKRGGRRSGGFEGSGEGQF